MSTVGLISLSISAGIVGAFAIMFLIARSASPKKEVVDGNFARRMKKAIESGGLDADIGRANYRNNQRNRRSGQ